MPNTPEYRKGYAKGYAAGRTSSARDAVADELRRMGATVAGLHARFDGVAREVSKIATLVDYVRRDPVANQPPKLPLFYRLWATFRALLP